MDYGQALGIYTLLLFGIIVVPGMDMFFVIANALTAGRRAGLAAVGGIMVGGVIHTLFGALAVGVLTKLPPMIFQGMILVGAAYMAFIGYSLLASTIRVEGVGLAARRSQGAIFWQGTITCLLNPKAYLFVLAVYPQYMRPAFGPIWSQALVLGSLTVAMQALIYGSMALGAGRARDSLTGHPQVTIWIGRTAGLLFVVAALFTALHGMSLQENA